MTHIETKAFIENRKARVIETLEAVDLLASNNLYSGAINRLYYAVFYAASALLAKHELRAKSHTGIINLLDQHFVKTGEIDSALAGTFRKTFTLRQLGDYGDTPPLEKSDFDKVELPARELIAKILSLL